LLLCCFVALLLCCFVALLLCCFVALLLCCFVVFSNANICNCHKDIEIWCNHNHTVDATDDEGHPTRVFQPTRVNFTYNSLLSYILFSFNDPVVKSHFEVIKQQGNDDFITSFFDTEFYKHPKLYRGNNFFVTDHDLRYCVGDVVEFVDEDKDTCYGRIELLQFEEHKQLVIFHVVVGVCGCVWVCVGVCGCVWVCVGVCGCGCVWVCMGESVRVYVFCFCFCF
jgi:hypothetical protein